MKNAAIIYKIVTWSLTSLFLAIFTFAAVREVFSDILSGSDIFIPGVLIFLLVPTLLLVFSITRIIKYIRLSKQQ